MDIHLPPSLQKLWELILSGTRINQLSPKELKEFSDPDALIFSLPIGITMPEEATEELGDIYLQYFDFMVNELCILMRNTGCKKELAQLLNEAFIEVIQDDTFNIDMTYQMVKIIKTNQIQVDPQITTRLAEVQSQDIGHQNAKPKTPEQLAEDLIDFIKQQGIQTGVEFCRLISDDLAMLPLEGVRLILPQFKSQSWIVDALLLLSLHKDPELCQLAADLLSQLPEKKWKKLTNRNYLTLIQRFGDEAVKANLPQWNRLAMKYAKQKKPGQVLDLYVSFPDGNQSAVFIGLIKEPNSTIPHLFGSVFRLNYGLVDSHFRSEMDYEEYDQIIHTLTSEVGAINCDPLLLSQLMPWALATQQTCPEKMSSELLHILALLPPQWTEPQPFTLDNIAKVCKFDPDAPRWKERGRLGSSLLKSTPLINTWLIEDIEPDLKKPRQIRERYYIQESQRYTQALALGGLLSLYNHEDSFFISKPESYLATAYALKEDNLNRKTFPLFDWLTDESIQRQNQKKLMDSIEQQEDPKGYVIKVELMDSKPKVWRRFTVSNSVDLDSFHHLLQDIIGWEHAHLYMFHTHLGHIDNTDESDMPADEVPLSAVLNKEGDSIEYIYDFGDHWAHTVTLEKINKRDCYQPKVTAGNGACPPEDCGGIWGYDDLLELTKKKKLTEEEQERLEWLGMEEWDARQFDKHEVNALLENVYSGPDIF